jgi:hypothetical protein
MGFTQRQAAGKFTRDEADAFIGRLRDADVRPVKVVRGPGEQRSVEEQVVRHISAERLAVELRRRGWTVIAP